MGPDRRAVIVAVVAVSLLAAFTAFSRSIAAALIAGMVAVAALLMPPWGVMRFMADDAPLHTHADVFERLQQRLTPQDRVQLAVPGGDPGLQEKSATLFGFHAVSDYEALATHRYAEYLKMRCCGVAGRCAISTNSIFTAHLRRHRSSGDSWIWRRRVMSWLRPPTRL